MANIIPLPTAEEAFESFRDGFSCFSEVEPYLINKDDVYLNKCLDLVPFRLVSSVHDLEEYRELDYPSDLLKQIEAEIADYKKALRTYRPESPLCDYGE